MQSVRWALYASLGMAIVSTAGDFIWATWIPEHRRSFGIAHGLLVFAAVGFAIGFPAGRPLGGMTGGAAIGAGAAILFYLLAPVLGYSAMFVAWCAIWIALVALHDNLKRG